MSCFFQTATMRKQENQPARPAAAGFLSVPLFNQKKRNRIPLTSTPSENEFFSHSDYMAGPVPGASPSTSGTYGCFQATGPSSGAPQRLLWNRPCAPPAAPPQRCDSSRPAPGPVPAMRNYAPIPHPYKAGGPGSKIEQPSNTVRQQDSGINSRRSEHQPPRVSESAQIKPQNQNAFSQMSQQSFYGPSSPNYQGSQQARPPPAPVPPPNRPSAPVAQSPNDSWKFSNSFGPQKPPSEGRRTTNQPPAARQTQSQKTFPTRPAIENSLRILTAVIPGMRHWSPFKDKAPYLFEIFATLDSAVTLGRHGAKNFLMRDGKEVVQCVFYENEQELPRLIRGQVHRCVGNYDRGRDVLTCVSVRPGLPSELRNAQEAVKACDAEMRVLLKSLHEI